MSKKNIYKSGFTLAELSVVIGLIAILSVSIVTFTSTISMHIQNYYAVLDVVDDVTFCRKLVVAWVSHFDRAEYEIQVLPQKMIATDGENNYELFMQEDVNEDGETVGVMVAQYDNGKSGTYVTNRVSGVGFASSGELYKCYISCRATGAGSDTSERYERYEFVVSTKVR